MSIHPPKQISSTEGLGVNTTKAMVEISEGVSISTEIWKEMNEPWREGETIIAKSGYVWKTKWEAGKPYIITKFLNTAGELVGVYCDVSRPVRKKDKVFSFTDLTSMFGRQTAKNQSS